MSLRLGPGRTALITGGAAGIGAAIAARVVARGADVVLVDRDAGALRGMEQQLGAGGGEVLGVVADVGDRDELAAVRAAARARFGAVHLLCLNAGVTPRAAPARGLLPAPGLASYAATKHAVVGLMGSLAGDLAAAGHDHLGVTTLCPGPVATELLRAAVAEVAAVAPGPGAVVDAHARAEQVRDPDVVAELALRAAESGDTWAIPVPPDDLPRLAALHGQVREAAQRGGARPEDGSVRPWSR